VARERVLSAIRADGSLPESYEGPGADQADASALLAVMFGLIGRRDARASALVDATRAALGSGAFLYRYPPGSDDGFTGIEGAFIPASWWAVSALAVIGRTREAEDLANRICAALPALIPEEVDPRTGEGRGNTPLVWSHIEAARALSLLEVASIRKRVGPAGVAAWRVARHLRLRARRRWPR
jgi:GH15 family glucan-1,4-alpha-glucosidase